jgi:hypothetical protein
MVSRNYDNIHTLIFNKHFYALSRHHFYTNSSQSRSTEQCLNRFHTSNDIIFFLSLYTSTFQALCSYCVDEKSRVFVFKHENKKEALHKNIGVEKNNNKKSENFFFFVLCVFNFQSARQTPESDIHNLECAVFSLSLRHTENKQPIFWFFFLVEMMRKNS